MATWMFYGCAVSLLFGAAGLAAERALLHFRRPFRWVWAFVIVGSTLLPLFVILPFSPASGPAGSAAIGLADPALVASALPTSSVPASLIWVDRALGIGWGLGTLALFAGLFRSAVALRRARRSWRLGMVAGQRVLISERTGPAVVGFFGSEIVVPAWILREDPTGRSSSPSHPPLPMRWSRSYKTGSGSPSLWRRRTRPRCAMRR
jgi:hypothetical protein